MIEKQIQAFQRDDAPGAFAQASPFIQSMFRTPERFMAMVRAGYQAVYRPRAYLFLELVPTEGAPTQRVLFTGFDGETVIALSSMQPQPGGGCKINGVFLQPSQKKTT